MSLNAFCRGSRQFFKVEEEITTTPFPRRETYYYKIDKEAKNDETRNLIINNNSNNYVGRWLGLRSEP